MPAFISEDPHLAPEFIPNPSTDDVTGKVIDGLDNRINLSLTDEQYQSELNSGVEWNKAIALRPEAKTVRVLVQDRATSKIGSLILPVAEIK